MRHESRVGDGPSDRSGARRARAVGALRPRGPRGPDPTAGFVAEQSVGPHVGLSAGSDPVAIAPAPASSYGGAM